MKHLFVLSLVFFLVQTTHTSIPSSFMVRNLKAHAVGNSFILTWQPPLDDSEAINEYVITAKSAQIGHLYESRRIPGSRPNETVSFMLDGLEPSAEYEIAVIPATKLGLGVPSLVRVSARTGRRPLPVSVRVLDSGTGRPASNVAVDVFTLDHGEWRRRAGNTTAKDGTCTEFTTEGAAAADMYKLRIHTGDHFLQEGVQSQYPYIEVVFKASAPAVQHHVMILVSLSGYSVHLGVL